MLTEITIKALKPKTKVYRVSDAVGLCLEVHPNGRRHWRLRYRYANKSQMMSLGPWPLISLALARRKRDDARRLLYDGIDPVRHKREQAEARLRERDGLFPVVAKAWLDTKEHSVGTETYRKMKLVVEGDLIPALRRHALATLATKDCTQQAERVVPSGAKPDDRDGSQQGGQPESPAARKRRHALFSPHQLTMPK